VNSGTIWGRFVEKTRGQKSRATVPLKGQQRSSLNLCVHCTVALEKKNIV
jgi:hypothetical protein